MQGIQKFFSLAANEGHSPEKAYLPSMKRVTGIGGVFFRCKDVAATKAWYEKHLGIPAGPYGHVFVWENETSSEPGCTTWSPFSLENKYFSVEQPFMVNYRVADLEALLAALKEEGVQVDGDMQVYDYGKFGWIIDCDGRKVELWEPIDQPLTDADTNSQ